MGETSKTLRRYEITSLVPGAMRDLPPQASLCQSHEDDVSRRVIIIISVTWGDPSAAKVHEESSLGGRLSSGTNTFSSHRPRLREEALLRMQYQTKPATVTAWLELDLLPSAQS